MAEWRNFVIPEYRDFGISLSRDFGISLSRNFVISLSHYFVILLVRGIACGAGLDGQCSHAARHAQGGHNGRQDADDELDDEFPRFLVHNNEIQN